MLEEVQDQVLKSKVRKRDRGMRGVKEVEWVTDEIREGVKEKQRLNRLKRNSRGRERIRWEVEMLRQKAWVKELVNREKGGWEEKLTKRARESRDRGKTVWKVIRKLQGKGQERGGKVYGGEEELGEEEAWGEMVEKWKGICQMR